MKSCWNKCMVDRRRSTVTADSMDVWEAGGRADGASVTQIAILTGTKKRWTAKVRKSLKRC